MRITRIGYALGIAAAVAIAGCSSNGSSLGPIAQGPIGQQSVARNHVPIIQPAKLVSIHMSAPSHAKSWASPDAAGTLVYGCAYGLSECKWFKHNGALKGTITGLINPQGIGINPTNGDVYVANTGASNVLVYAKGSATVSKTLNDAGQYPVSVSVDRNGTVYVMNIFDTSFGPGSISVYVGGSTTVTRMITDPNLSQGISVSVDEHHLLIACFNGNSGGECDEFPHAKGHGVPKITGMYFSGGVSFDNSENVVVSDQTVAFNVWNTSFSMCATTSQGGTDEVMLGISKSGTELAGGDATNGTIDQFSYGSCSGGVGSMTHAYPAFTPSDTEIGAAIDPGPKN